MPGPYRYGPYGPCHSPMIQGTSHRPKFLKFLKFLKNKNAMILSVCLSVSLSFSLSPFLFLSNNQKQFLFTDGSTPRGDHLQMRRLARLRNATTTLPNSRNGILVDSSVNRKDGENVANCLVNNDGILIGESPFQPKVDSSPPDITSVRIDNNSLQKIIHINKSPSITSRSGSRSGSRSSRTSSSAYNYVRAVVKTPKYDNVKV